MICHLVYINLYPIFQYIFFKYYLHLWMCLIFLSLVYVYYLHGVNSPYVVLLLCSIPLLLYLQKNNIKSNQCPLLLFQISSIFVYVLDFLSLLYVYFLCVEEKSTRCDTFVFNPTSCFICNNIILNFTHIPPCF